MSSTPVRCQAADWKTWFLVLFFELLITFKSSDSSSPALPCAGTTSPPTPNGLEIPTSTQSMYKSAGPWPSVYSRLPQPSSKKHSSKKTAQSFCKNFAPGKGLPLPFPLPGAPKVAPDGSTIAFLRSEKTHFGTHLGNNNKRHQMTPTCRQNDTNIC